MGRNTKTKNSKKDSVFITTATFQKTFSDLNKVCPPSIQQRLEENPYLKEGVRLYLKPFGEKFIIAIQEIEVGVLSKENSKKIKTCFENGIKYKGVVVKEKAIYYARFYRNSE